MANRADAWRAYLRSEEGNPQDKPCKRTYYYVQVKDAQTGYWNSVPDPYRFAIHEAAIDRANQYADRFGLEMYYDVRVLPVVE